MFVNIDHLKSSKSRMKIHKYQTIHNLVPIHTSNIPTAKDK